jgi:hypothetical protein
MSTAFSYNPLTLAFKGLIEVADATTRAYRAVGYPTRHKVNLDLLWG